VGEILTLTGTFLDNPIVAACAAVGVILSAVYALTLYRRVTFGELVNPKLAGITDVTAREIAVFAPLIIATLWLGVYPSIALDLTKASAEAMIAPFAALK
jgi:NADH-quinone oxidoreductase subunit M